MVFNTWLLQISWADTKQQNRKHNENKIFEFFILINESLFVYVISLLQTSILSFQLHFLKQRIFRMQLFTASWFIKLIQKMTSTMQNFAADFTSLTIKYKANDAPLDVFCVCQLRKITFSQIQLWIWIIIAGNFSATDTK